MRRQAREEVTSEAGDIDKEVKMGIYSVDSPSYIHLENNKYDYLGNTVKNNKDDSARDRSTICETRSASCEIEELKYNKVFKCEKYPNYRCER